MTGNAIGFADYLKVGSDSIFLKDVPNPSFVATPFVAAFDGNGNPLGIETYVDELLGNGSLYEITPVSMKVYGDKVFMSGFMEGDFRFGSDSIMTHVFEELFLIQMDPSFLNIATNVPSTDTRGWLHAYPNPLQGMLNIEIEDFGKREMSTLTLMDLQGRKLRIEKTIERTVKWDLTELQAGWYILHFKQNGKNQAIKLQIL